MAQENAAEIDESQIRHNMEVTVMDLDVILPSTGSHGKILGRRVTQSDLHDPISKACFVCHLENCPGRGQQ